MSFSAKLSEQPPGGGMLTKRLSLRNTYGILMIESIRRTDLSPVTRASHLRLTNVRCMANTTQLHDRSSLPDGVNTVVDMEKVKHLRENLKGRLILAPLTRGNNLPFRRLIAQDFDGWVTTSEMILSRNLIKGDPRENALIKRSDAEHIFGVQIATKTIDEGIKSGIQAAEAGAQFLDFNCGCPIYEVTRRGLGSQLLRKPKKLSRLIGGIAGQIPIPMTVKIRTGIDSSSINVHQIVRELEDTGIAAVTIHGRTAMQRYKRESDWSLIEEVARESSLPCIGNGDILEVYEAKRRITSHGCHAVSVGRGALIKPWIFKEFAEDREIHPTAEERVAIYRKLTKYMKEHFGDDDWGKRKAFYFLPFHLGFFSRYRPLPAQCYEDYSLNSPLISTRWESIACKELGETPDSLPLLERLLRCTYEKAHEEIAEILWTSESDQETIENLNKVAESNIIEWEMAVKKSDRNEMESSRESEG